MGNRRRGILQSNAIESAQRLAEMIETKKVAYILFDGDCGICTFLAVFAKTMARDGRFVVLPFQAYPEDALRRYGLSYADCGRKLHTIAADGRVYRGAFAINHFLLHYFPWNLLAILIYSIPILLLLEILGYALVARLRHRLSRWLGLPACPIVPHR